MPKGPSRRRPWTSRRSSSSWGRRSKVIQDHGLSVPDDLEGDVTREVVPEHAAQLGLVDDRGVRDPQDEVALL